MPTCYASGTPTPTATALFAQTDDSTEVEEAEEIPVWDDKEEDGQPTFGEQLSAAQKRNHEQLLKEFAGVMSNHPGHTNLAEHNIHTGDARPIKLPPYRLPHAYRDTIQQEIEEMLQRGIIEPNGLHQLSWSTRRMA